MKNLKQTILLVLCIVGFQLTIAQPAPPNGKKWEKVDVLSDEFNGNSLNTSKWLINDPQWEGRRPARFETSSVSVSGGNLKISASKKSNPFSGWTHSGGLVRAKTRSLYGYYETRMKANKTFMSSTFWLINKRNEFTGCDFRTTELDITETVGVNSNGANWVNNTIRNMNSNTHSRGTSCNSTPVGVKGANAALGGQSWQAYHTYGVWWKSKTEVLLYLDGKFVNKITPAADFNLPMYLRMVVETYDWNPPKAGPGSLVSLQGNNGKYASSENGSKAMNCNRSSAQSWEKFNLSVIGNVNGSDLVTLQGNNGKYVSSENGLKDVMCNRSAVGAWEKFVLINHGNNVYSFRGNNGKYLSSENGNKAMTCSRSSMGDWEKFKISFGLRSTESEVESLRNITGEIATYPNPIHIDSPLSMSFKLGEKTTISVALYNAVGQEVLSNELGTFKAGNHDLELFTRSSKLSSGIYMLKIKMNDNVTVDRLVFN